MTSPIISVKYQSVSKTYQSVFVTYESVSVTSQCAKEGYLLLDSFMIIFFLNIFQDD